MHRGTASFDTHAWMLKSLLRHSKGHHDLFQLYVVAADFKKMLARMNHPVSTQYLACLRRQVMFRPFVPIEESVEERDDTLFLGDIPIIAKSVKTKIPNLEMMAQAAEKGEPFKLYNKDTCMELHELLIEFLDSFHKSLVTLEGLQKLEVQKGKDHANVAKIKTQLQNVLAFGQALRGIARGSAIKEHFKTFAPFLAVNSGTFWRVAHEPNDDGEFFLLKPHSTFGYSEPLQPWRSFLDWLRLMVHHIDAMDVLDLFLINFDLISTTDLSIKILYPPKPDDNMLPWDELLANEEYFPPIPHSHNQPSADKLIEFLRSPTLDSDPDGITVKDVITDVEALMVTLSKTDLTPLTSHIDSIIEALTDLRDSSSDGCKDSVAAILVQTEAFESDSTIHGRLHRLEGILNMLQNLKGSFSSPTLDEDGRVITDLIKKVEVIKVRVTEPGFASNVEKLKEALTELKNSSSDGWKDYVEEIFEQVESLESDGTTNSRLCRLERIWNMLQNLKGSFLLYKSVQPGTPLSRGKDFNGGTHCEALGANSNSLSGNTGLDDDSLKELLHEYGVCRVSVTCSNLCQTLQYRELYQ